MPKEDEREMADAFRLADGMAFGGATIEHVDD